MDAAIAGAAQVALSEGCSSRGEKHGCVGAIGVDDAAGGVRSARNRVHHDHLRPARHHRVAVGHRDGRDLVGNGDGLREHLLLCKALGVGLDDGCEVRSPITEEVVHTPCCQKLQIGLCDSFYLDSLGHYNPPKSTLSAYPT